MDKALYKGFSSFQYEYNKSFRLTNLAVVKRDLLNHIFTRFGERVGMPQFGTTIPDSLMQQMDMNILESLDAAINFVIEYDPRVALNGQVTMDADFDNHSVRFFAPLYYIELNLNDLFELHLEFDQ
jgi:phage baseplate assembly protein W